MEKWLHITKDALFDAEDVLNELATDALQCKLEGESRTGKNRVRNRSFIPTSVNLFKEGLESRIRKIIGKLENISKQKDVLGLKDNVAGRFSEIKQRLPITSLVEEPCVYGRDGDEKQIVEVLLRDDEPRKAKIGVVPIVGMGGVLAQLVYNNGKVKDHFALRIWVCVTDRFDVMRITKTLVESITLITPELNDLNLLQVSLREKVVGNRFLLVLDDSTRQGGDFPCLLELSIRACPNLRELSDLFPSLEILDIDGCLELAALPRLPLIRELVLVKCYEAMLQSVAKFTSLTYLHLSHISKIEFLPEGFFHHLTALEELQISYFCELTTLSNDIELQNLPYLKSLKISGCPNLQELP